MQLIINEIRRIKRTFVWCCLGSVLIFRFAKLVSFQSETKFYITKEKKGSGSVFLSPWIVYITSAWSRRIYF